jgi:hypothetical protein
MAFLFILYALVIYFAITGQKKRAFILACVNLVLCLLVFIHHITLTLPIRL